MRTDTNLPFDRLPLIVAIVGPTAVGKSDLAMHLAQVLPIEIVSADSRQVYRGLDVGTAKPTRDEQQQVPHHLIDVVDPREDFSVAEFQDRAYMAIDGTLSRGKLPVLVGGTGLYVNAIVDGIRLPRVAPDPVLRRDLEQVAREQGADVLHRQLAAVDACAAERIDPRNVRRVIRALEVILKSGELFSSFREPAPRYHVLQIGLTADRATLYRRIDERVDRQIDEGLVEETRHVLARGCPPSRPALGGLGYREVVAYLEGRLALQDAIERIKFETHRFVRQQYTWFRLSDPAIHWIDVSTSARDEALRLLRAHLSLVAANTISVSI